MRTTLRRHDAVRVRDIDDLIAQWPRLPERDVAYEPRSREAAAFAEPEPRRRVGARWEAPEPEEDFPFDDEPEMPRRGKRMRWVIAIVLIAVAAVIAGTFAIAQQAGKAGHAEAAATTVAPPAAADGDESAIVDRAVIGDWIFGCVDQPRPAPRFCFIRQQLADNKTKTPIFTWTVGQDAKGNLVAVWQTPTGVLIGQGMLFDIGMERPIPVPYRECTRGQCQAVANLPRISSSDWRRQRRLEPPSWPHRGTGWHSTSASRDLPRGWQR